MHQLSCRSCAAPLKEILVDLGASPLSNAFLRQEDLDRGEPFYPLCVRICTQCWLAQLPTLVAPENIFQDYAYFSSYSESWLRHCEQYVDRMVEDLHLGANHLVVELASNDGYLLQFFAKRGIPVLGVEPAANVAAVATGKGIRTLVRFFGVETARTMVATGDQADLLIGNNVLAHAPDLNDFIAGMKLLLKPTGTITMEFPHLLRLMEENQFDTIYHEHFSYFSLLAVEQAFRRHGITLYDVEELATHGGSLRIYGRHDVDTSRPVSDRIRELRNRELAKGYDKLETYRSFARQVEETKLKLLEFLIHAKHEGKTVVGYGAPAKGNTLLNYCGVRTDFIDYTVDRSPHKQGSYLPGTRIPIYGPEKIFETKPNYVLILPWNIKDEIVEQMKKIRDWGGRFVVPIPSVKVVP